MVLTRVQVDGLSREELIEELLLNFSDIMDQLNVQLIVDSRILSKNTIK